MGEALAALSPLAASLVAGLPPELVHRRVAEVSPEGFGLLAERTHAAGLELPEISSEMKRTAQKLGKEEG